MPPPGPDEYAPFYDGYVLLASGRSPMRLLSGQVAMLREMCGGLSEEEALHRYAEGKWSIKEVLGHLADTERIFSYRMLRIARGDSTPLPGFDENMYVDAALSDSRSVPSLLEEFETIRFATRVLLASLPFEALTRRGTASGSTITVRALAYIIAGHVEHHIEILHDRYGLSPDSGSRETN